MYIEKVLCYLVASSKNLAGIEISTIFSMTSARKVPKLSSYGTKNDCYRFIS